MQCSFAEALQRASPDFQKDAEGYSIDKAWEVTSTYMAMLWESGSDASLSLSRCLSRTQSIVLMISKAGQSHCLCMTWWMQCAFQLTPGCQPRCRSPERSVRLGAVFLNAVADVCTQL